jgi:predicted alpha/beta-hydrolase family hydrolase
MDGADGPWLACGAREVQPCLVAPGWFAFRVMLPANGLRLRSPVFRALGDGRALGFAVQALEVLTPAERRGWAAGDGAAADGFHAAEPGGWQWTDGDARLPDALFAGLGGPALLVVRGFGRAAGTSTHGLAFLAGDSHPMDGHVEAHLLRKLHPFPGAALVRQVDMLRAGEGSTRVNLGLRQERLSAAVGAWSGGRVLVGRSSGARVATLFAARHGAVAVVCLGYPFQPLSGEHEPERYAHLARIGVPVLIVQGRGDPYGGEELVTRLPLSPSVRVALLDVSHEFHLDEPGWDAVARQVLLFLAETVKEKEAVLF